MTTQKIHALADDAERAAAFVQTVTDPELLLSGSRMVHRAGRKMVDLSKAIPPSDPEPPEPPTDPNDPIDPVPPSDPEPIVIPTTATTETIRNEGGAGMTVKADHREIRRVRFEYGSWMGISVPSHDPTNGVVGLLLDECRFVTGWYGDRKGWGVRGYDMGAFHYRNTVFECVLPFAYNIEHGNYQNLWAGGLLENCYWFQCPGQGSQYVWSGREGESANFTGLSGKDIPGDWVEYMGGGMLNCGYYNNGRASFMLSMFPGQVGLRLKDFRIQKFNEPRTHGAVLFDGNYYQQAFELLNTWIEFTGVPDREAVQVWRPKYMLVDGGDVVQEKGIRVIGAKPDTLDFVKATATSTCPLWLGHKEQQANGSWKTIWDLQTTIGHVAGTRL